MEYEMDDGFRLDEMPGIDNSPEKSDEYKLWEEPKGCLAPPPLRHLEELAVEGCVCVALLSVATAALSLLLLKKN